MCGCGKRFDPPAPSFTRHPSSSGPSPLAATTGTPAIGLDIALTYVGRSAVLLKGPGSGRVYALRPGTPPVMADPRDGEPFLTSGLFTRPGSPASYAVSTRTVMTTHLNPLAASIATALTRAHPEFASHMEIRAEGDVELYIPAPAGSEAGALVVSTARGEAIWIRFAPPQMSYAVDNEDELLTIVNALLDDRVMFVHITDARNEWAGTTLVAGDAAVSLETGQKATVRSWSGRFDRAYVAETPAPSGIEFHDSQLLAVNVRDAVVELRLAAYVHAWDSGREIRRGTGWIQPVSITLTGAHASAVKEPLPVDISGGDLTIGAQDLDSLVPLPFAAAERAVLRLELTTGQTFEAAGITVEVKATGPARYIEDLPADLWLGRS
jgi:hypothetical protein